MNRKRVYRLYRDEGLAVRRRKRKRVAVARQPLPVPTRLNEGWAMDFMSDALSSGRRYRVLNVVDVLSREALAGEVDTSLPAARVIQALEEIAIQRGYPARITLDNGPELRSMALDTWAYEHGVVLDFIQPGKPIQNASWRATTVGCGTSCSTCTGGGASARRATRSTLSAGLQRGAAHSGLGHKTPSEFARHYAVNSNPQRLAS